MPVLPLSIYFKEGGGTFKLAVQNSLGGTFLGGNDA